MNNLTELEKRQFKYRQKFFQALRQGGSWIIDWDEVWEKSFGTKPPPINGWDFPNQDKE